MKYRPECLLCLRISEMLANFESSKNRAVYFLLPRGIDFDFRQLAFAFLPRNIGYFLHQ